MIERDEVLYKRPTYLVKKYITQLEGKGYFGEKRLDNKHTSKKSNSRVKWAFKPTESGDSCFDDMSIVKSTEEDTCRLSSG